jgi:hydrogenase-4 component F
MRDPHDIIEISTWIMLALPLVLALVIFICWKAYPAMAYTQRFEVFSGWVSIVVSIILMLISVYMLTLPVDRYPWQYQADLIVTSIGFRVDSLSVFFIFLVNLIACAAAVNSLPYLNARRGVVIDGKEDWIYGPLFFHIASNLFHVTMLLVPIVDNLIGLWVAVELTALISAFLVAFEGKATRSWEAAWKYIMITSTGIVLALLGTMFLAQATIGAPNLNSFTACAASTDARMDWSCLMELARAGVLNGELTALAFVFALVGYGTKAGLAPMHAWLLDGHGEAPAPISALLSGVLLKCALYAVLRFYTITNTALGYGTERAYDTTFTATILLGTGLISLLIAAPFILKDGRFKRVLAAHSLEHMGIITFGIGIGGPIALYGAVLHCLNHAVAKSLMFIAFGNIIRRVESGLGQSIQTERDEAEKLRGLLQIMPGQSAALGIGGLALLGTPPFSLFFSELFIIWGGVSEFLLVGRSSSLPGWMLGVAVALFVISTTVIAWGLIRHLARMLLGRPNLMGGSQVGAVQMVLEAGPVLVLWVLMVAGGLLAPPQIAELVRDSVDLLQGVKVTP